jgi:hypothetical protein
MNTDARSPSAEDDLKQLSPDELIARILGLQSNNWPRHGATAPTRAPV